MLQVWTMKFTESTNIFYISDMVSRACKLNIKQTFMRNHGSCNCLCGKWAAVRE